jgi:hypothetical protein
MNGSHDRWSHMDGSSNSNPRRVSIHQQGFNHNSGHIPYRQSSNFDGRFSYFGLNNSHQLLGHANQQTVAFHTNAALTNMFPVTRNFGNTSSHTFQPPEIRQPNRVPIHNPQRSGFGVKGPKPLQVSQQPLSSKYQRIVYSTELKHDYCLFRLNFLLRSTKVGHATVSTESLQCAQLDFFRNIDPLFEIPRGFDRRLRSWWENRHRYLSEDELSNPQFAHALAACEQQKQKRKQVERDAGPDPKRLKTRMINQSDSDGTALHDSIYALRHHDAALGRSSGGDRHSAGGVGIIGDDDAAMNLTLKSPSGFDAMPRARWERERQHQLNHIPSFDDWWESERRRQDQQDWGRSRQERLERDMRYLRHAQRRAALSGSGGNGDATGDIRIGDSDSADGGWEERMGDPQGGDAEQIEAVGAVLANAGASPAVSPAVGDDAE